MKKQNRVGALETLVMLNKWLCITNSFLLYNFFRFIYFQCLWFYEKENEIWEEGQLLFVCLKIRQFDLAKNYFKNFKIIFRIRIWLSKAQCIHALDTYFSGNCPVCHYFKTTLNIKSSFIVCNSVYKLSLRNSLLCFSVICMKTKMWCHHIYMQTNKPKVDTIICLLPWTYMELCITLLFQK